DAEDFAAELLRIRLGQAIRIRPVPIRRRVGRFVRRHPLPSALLLVLVLTQLLLLWLSERAGRARAMAEHESAQARRTLDFVDLLAQRYVLEVAHREADRLVPPWPERLEAIDAW